MIEYIKGHLSLLRQTDAVIEANGIGYRLHISLNTYSKIQGLTECRLLTHLQVSMQGQGDFYTLYGFAEEEERQMFLHLISVSGIGANSARTMLSALTPAEVRLAIISENEGSFRMVKGIGTKTAKRLIVELKDKLLKDNFVDTSEVVLHSAASNLHREEALAALVTLGYAKPAAQKALNQVLKNNPSISSVETLIRESLRQLSS